MKLVSNLFSLAKIVFSVFGIVYLLNRLNNPFENREYRFEVDSLFAGENNEIKQKPKQSTSYDFHDFYSEKVD